MDMLNILIPVLIAVVVAVVFTSYTHPMFWVNIKETIRGVFKGRGR